MPEIDRSSKYVLAIDMGTGGPKVGLVDERGHVAASAFAPVRLIFLPDEGAEHDPAEWWSAIVGCARQVLRESGVSPAAVVAVGVTSMWCVTVPVDERGQPTMNVISWMDGRGAPYNRKIIQGFPSLQGYKITAVLKYVNRAGMAPGPRGIESFGHMQFVKHARPEVYRRTFKFLEAMDYINLRLTGKFAATQNTAFATLMVDNRRLGQREYDPGLVKASGIDRAKLPDLLPIDGVLGTLTPEVAAELGLSPETPVVCAVNDDSSSAVGAGAIADTEVVAVMSTSGYLAAHVPSKRFDLANVLGSMPSAIPGRYLFWGEMLNNGKVLESSLKNLIYAQDGFDTGPIPADMYRRADQVAAQAVPGSGGVLFLPWFNGLGAPGDDPYMRGGFLNLSHKTTRADLARSIFEGCAMQWRSLRRPAEKLTRQSFPYWRLTGGGALSDTWSQIMADVVGVPMHRQADPRNNNVIGMGLLAFNRLGLVKLEDIPPRIEFDRVFEPNPKNSPVYDRMFEQFLAARDKIKPIFHALNEPRLT